MAGKDFPQSYEDWEKKARTTLDDGRFRYIASGAGYGETAAANQESFRKWKIIPRVLKEVGNRRSAISLFGASAAAPLILAPVRGLSYIHRDGDLGVAKVAVELGLPLVLSNFATTSIEKVAQAMGSSARWFQLFPGRDEEIMKSMLRRAESSGYSAVVVTLDKAANYPHYGGPADLDYEKFGHEVYFSDPVFRAKFEGGPEREFEAATKLWREIRFGPGLSLDGLHGLIKATKLPVVLKGILHPKDAELAVEYGAAGVVVSNHGGRTLDGEVASLDALADIRKAVGEGFPVLLDGGVRSGADMVKALALGANAVLIGKAYAFGLGAAGEEGVRRVLRGLIKEFDSAMGICGALRVEDLDRSMVMSV